MPTYMITDGNGSYIRHDKTTNRYVPVKSKLSATVWTDGTKAVNIHHALPKKVKDVYRVISESDVRSMSPVQPAPSEGTQELCPANLAELKSRLEDAVDLLTETSGRIALLEQHLSSIDKEVVDIEHFIEFNQLNACDGYNAYRKLHDRLLLRRSIKNELRVRSFLVSLNSAIVTLSRARDEVVAVDSQTYTPRILTELFE